MTIYQKDKKEKRLKKKSDNTDTMCKVLIFGCIAAVILMTAAYGVPLEKTTQSPHQKQRLDALIADLELLKHIDNNFLDFYTPNDKWECKHATRACFLKELNVLKQDVDKEDMQQVINIEKNLKDLKIPGFSNATCKKCESNEKKKFAEFHQELTSFLQSIMKETVANWSRSPRPASLASILKRLNMAALHRRLARQVPLRNGELQSLCINCKLYLDFSSRLVR
ncbi:hypothetical protein IHE44_0013393 [Lamprotornis superbus]|uniref:Interleukin n=1 Tax=Lamprotornis superbus TaxID=245042 RepID=A0A835NR40_9PASS|nr:hypothetical protein IHE44_0013393 [Lamprotornis superbus]